MIRFFDDFPRDYEVALEPEVETATSQVEFGTVGADGPVHLLVQIVPYSGRPWVGLFRGGALSRNAATGVYSWPDPGRLGVFCSGRGYLVRSNEPSDFEELGSGLVTQVMTIPERGKVLLADPWEVQAFGSAGLEWRTGRISVEGLNLTGVRDGTVEGTVERGSGPVALRIDLRSGQSSVG